MIKGRLHLPNYCVKFNSKKFMVKWVAIEGKDVKWICRWDVTYLYLMVMAGIHLPSHLDSFLLKGILFDGHFYFFKIYPLLKIHYDCHEINFMQTNRRHENRRFVILCDLWNNHFWKHLLYSSWSVTIKFSSLGCGAHLCNHDQSKSFSPINCLLYLTLIQLMFIIGMNLFTQWTQTNTFI